MLWIPNQEARTPSPCVTEAESPPKEKQSNISDAQLKKSSYTQRRSLLATEISTFQNLRKKTRGLLPCSLHQQFDTIDIQSNCQKNILILISDRTGSEQFTKSTSACTLRPDCPELRLEELDWFCLFSIHSGENNLIFTNLLHFPTSINKTKMCLEGFMLNASILRKLLPVHGQQNLQISLSSCLNLSPKYISSCNHDFDLALKQQSFFEELWKAN